MLSDFDATAKQDQAAAASFVANSAKNKVWDEAHDTAGSPKFNDHFYSKWNTFCTMSAVGNLEVVVIGPIPDDL